ncbi:glycosyltransferase family 2 protein [Xylona heveae TC161]|uniref:chitin synthase n=1 Tax=Xylona heveae (strain CBS 132557 / TC161) TaxID=1328760 RepID=A0A165HDZ7_XYLHT|nr:glycosyltransferase family 2 protein [Xylona heveae TC161]KZF23365.1 glycosyltransferase family 2 protein [Xylona heveae TC161]
MVWFFQWFAFWTFAALLMLPWMLAVYSHVIHSLGRKKLANIVLNEHTAPKVIIFMPCYNEQLDVLLTAIDSIVECDYPTPCLHIFLSFDGEQEKDSYAKTLERLDIPASISKYPGAIDIVRNGVRITVSKFPHGGKRHCQKLTFQLAEKMYGEYAAQRDDLFVLFIDSDCILNDVCIQNFMYEMELKPGGKKKLLAMTGVITSTTGKNSLITLLQDMEYIHGQLFERCVESCCGSVTCLPGALTCIRFSALRKLSKEYFSDHVENCKDIFDFGKTHLGEDRWLTHLLMVGAQRSHQIKMCPGAFCKTEAVQTFKSLIKQRRRWFLGFITNEACMMTDIRIFKRYPALILVRLMQNTIRTTALLFFLMVISLATTSNKISNVPVGFIAISLGLNWLLMIYFGGMLGRYKVWLYPLMFLLNPIFNWIYMVYGICTAGQRTWGGPRADAATADENTTPQQAIEHAEASGNDLNIVPESFSAPTVLRKRSGKLPLQPPDSINGRFTSTESPSEPDYQEDGGDGLSLHEWDNEHSNVSQLPMHPENVSAPSEMSVDSDDVPISLPRRVESIVGLMNARENLLAKADLNEKEEHSDLSHTKDMAGQVSDSDEMETTKHRALDPELISTPVQGEADNGAVYNATAGMRTGNNAQTLSEMLSTPAHGLSEGVPVTGRHASRLSRLTRLGFMRIASTDRIDIESQTHSQPAFGRSTMSSGVPDSSEDTQPRGRRLSKSGPAGI